MAEKTYTLKITYNEDTDEILEYDEYIDEDNRWFSVGDVDLTEYWDEDTINRLKNKMYDLGES